MAEPTQKEVNKAIRDCKWRQNFMGVVICSGMCGPCTRVIENGDCDALQRLFAEKAKESGNETETSDS